MEYRISISSYEEGCLPSTAVPRTLAAAIAENGKSVMKSVLWQAIYRAEGNGGEGEWTFTSRRPLRPFTIWKVAASADPEALERARKQERKWRRV